MKEVDNELASLLNLENEEMPFEEHVQLVGEGIVDVECHMVELVDLAWGREFHLDLASHKDPMEGNMWTTNQHW